MKCISLWQPWATLVAIGAKRFETRSWPTSHRGTIAIHAAKKWNRELLAMCKEEPFFSELIKLRPNGDDSFYFDDFSPKIMPLGAILCVASLVDCVEIEPRNTPTEHRERAFGDYTPGRFKWTLDKVWPLLNPIPYRGAQGLFDVPDSVIDYARDVERLQEARQW